MAFPTHLLPSVFGILGNIISFCVFLAPVPTFCKIYRRKSTQGFQSIPYSVALFSCMLLLYYGYIKTENGMLIITINSIGFAIETTYLVIFLIYTTKESLISTLKLLALFNILLFGLIVLTTLLMTKHGPKRVAVVGWICAIFSVCVFAAPLSIMTPNVLGFAFGIAQMVLYMIYKGNKKQGRPAPIVVDMGAILEIQEKPTVDEGVESEIQDKDEMELRVVLEMQETPVGEDEGGGDKERIHS
ncbi:hypothetical protein L1987_63647 [Smallanthus sonchifolius]|uniref:Uncharacterized protein n=1 Tax=Smallanthus sonchifolius TaxID=185202 RepID=A0ACB9CDU7_9ASTR|nr:hypothetical protein L1987_63647 [Smallanthus sonchifolius]